MLAAGQRHLAAVATLDVGKQDLQQCADAAMRLHAEWLWQEGRADEASYPSGGGAIPWRRFRTGVEPRPSERGFSWVPRGRPRDDHANYRRYLDAVFMWANTVSLAHATPSPERPHPGDFFVLPGAPGHTVVVLDVAEAADGRRVALIGQSFMPAQSFHVLRPSQTRSWFVLQQDGSVMTPFWRRFPGSSLRRLDG